MKAHSVPQIILNKLILLILERQADAQTMYMPPLTCSVSPVM
jgi:hypothetical protein